MEAESRPAAEQATLLVATHNPGKLKEFRRLLTPLGLKAAGAGEEGLPEPPEDGATYEENAAAKALAAAAATGRAALSDDSGLGVDALGGAPGVVSARWAEQADGTRDFAAAMARVEEALLQAGAEPQGAAAEFVCVLALALGTGRPPLLFTGRVRGSLAFPPRGERGFGYDPIFRPEGEARSFAEMDEAEKERRNHRAAAFARFSAWLEAGGRAQL